MNAVWEFEDVSLATFLHQLHEQRILDTALDAMSMSMDGNTTTFRVARQAAVAGKIAFPIPGDAPLGGVFSITITGEDSRIGSRQPHGMQDAHRFLDTSTTIIP